MLRSFNSAVGHSVVMDSGLLLEFLSGSDIGSVINKMIFKNSYITSIMLTPLTLVEIYYVLRRKGSKEIAENKLLKIKSITTTIPLEEYVEIVGEFKASTSISLADVAVIGLAEYMGVKALFKHESKIDEQLKNNEARPFMKRIVFIEDFPFFKDSLKN